MFELVALMCEDSEPCQPHLIPGFEAATLAECQTLAQGWTGDGTPECRPLGPALEVREIAPGVWVHIGAIEEPDPENEGDVANLGFIVGGDSVAVVDSGGTRTIGEQMWRAIRQVTPLPISHVILTHMHPDHVLGATVLAESGAEIVGAEGLARAISDREDSYLLRMAQEIGDGFAGTTAPVVARELAEPTQIDLGGRVLELAPWPLAHTANDLTVVDRETRILFAGDLLFDQHCPSLDGSVVGWQEALTKLRALDVDRAVTGHGRVLDWPPDDLPLERYLQALETQTRAALDAGQRLADAALTVALDVSQEWALCGTYTPRNVTITFTQLEWD
ncbi:quinoprotein relay system zinc metallohydrolase 2 [Donghicola mangrovi]|uniref:Quinoprotein relay system zinc metallohydrolase 2 n=1 Tax=Donghicola mangrovi TaxID=2729614 RepID=A0A850QB25_9RHOB|nr:quinoprotein relay system zinc metallohydrolase 2 [Donghicola mangrovi]NVO23121.1 quinoprotein relay system zinc metallohydrolase 2 [Donghicola mangrovi]